MKCWCVLSFIFLFTSCIDFNINGDNTRMISGYTPVYSDNDVDLGVIESQEPRDITNAGKIFYYNNFLFVSAKDEGVHVFDNSNPENIQNIGFITINGNRNVAVKGDYIYANNYTDLVVIDISDVEDVELVQRFENQIGNLSDFAPPLSQEGVYYQCPDEDKLVVGWEESEFSNADCYKIN